MNLPRVLDIEALVAAVGGCVMLHAVFPNVVAVCSASAVDAAASEAGSPIKIKSAIRVVVDHGVGNPVERIAALEGVLLAKEARHIGRVKVDIVTGRHVLQHLERVADVLLASGSGKLRRNRRAGLLRGRLLIEQQRAHWQSIGVALVVQVLVPVACAENQLARGRPRPRSCVRLRRRIATKDRKIVCRRCDARVNASQHALLLDGTPKVGAVDLHVLSRRIVDSGDAIVTKQSLSGRLCSCSNKRNGSLRPIEFRSITRKEMQTIFEDWPAELENRIEGSVLVFLLAEELGQLSVGCLPLPEAARRRVQTGTGEHERAFTVEVIRSALGDDVDHAAGRAAVFSLVTTDLYLNLLNELERNRALATQRSVPNIRNFHAVNDEGVFRTARSIDRVSADAATGVVAGRSGHATADAAGLGVKYDARSVLQNGVEGAALGRALDDFLSYVGCRLARCDVDGLATRGDRHRLRDLAGWQVKIHCRRFPKLYDDILRLHSLKALTGYRDCVSSNWSLREGIGSRAVAHYIKGANQRSA